jgi:hypothetical protein
MGGFIHFSPVKIRLINPNDMPRRKTNGASSDKIYKNLWFTDDDELTSTTRVLTEVGKACANTHPHFLCRLAGCTVWDESVERMPIQKGKG